MPPVDRSADPGAAHCHTALSGFDLSTGSQMIR
jgi:hypothetical protein